MGLRRDVAECLEKFSRAAAMEYMQKIRDEQPTYSEEKVKQVFDEYMQPSAAVHALALFIQGLIDTNGKHIQLPSKEYIARKFKI